MRQQLLRVNQVLAAGLMRAHAAKTQPASQEEQLAVDTTPRLITHTSATSHLVKHLAALEQSRSIGIHSRRRSPRTDKWRAVQVTWTWSALATTCGRLAETGHTSFCPKNHGSGREIGHVQKK